MTEAEQIVRDLARCDEPIEGEWGRCLLCYADASTPKHDPSCPYERAWQWVQRNGQGFNR